MVGTIDQAVAKARGEQPAERQQPEPADTEDPALAEREAAAAPA